MKDSIEVGTFVRAADSVCGSNQVRFVAELVEAVLEHAHGWTDCEFVRLSATVPPDFGGCTRASAIETLGEAIRELAEVHGNGDEGTLAAVGVTRRGVPQVYALMVVRAERLATLANWWRHRLGGLARSVRVDRLTGWRLFADGEPRALRSDLEKALTFQFKRPPARYRQPDLEHEVAASGVMRGPWQRACTVAEQRGHPLGRDASSPCCKASLCCVCGNSIPPVKRIDAETCSSKCRKRRYRDAKRLAVET